MPVFRLTSIFQLSTAPTDLAVASIHVGGWTESIWTLASGTALMAQWLTVRQKRAIFLPRTARIVGFRVQAYEISGNKLLPGGSSAGREILPGSTATEADLPQVALQVSMTAQAQPNTSRMMLRGIPDFTMQGGEYQPSAAFKTAVTNYGTSLISPGVFGFVGRDLATPSVRVMSIAGPVVTVDAIPAGLVVGNFVRFHRVADGNGDPVSGAFNVTAIAGLNITCFGLNRVVPAPSGTLRQDLLNFFRFASLTPVRAMVKKVGRPSEQYRGRRSKVRK